MLIIFHYLGVFGYQLFKRWKKNHEMISEKNIKQYISGELENQIKFDPPVYRQRYGNVYRILTKARWRTKFKKLVDFGCAEYGLFWFIKELALNEIMFVDIDENLLNEKMYHIIPSLGDQLKRRSDPLKVSVYAGSVSEPDYRLCKTDVVTAIELIEHLYPDTLDALGYNIFSYIQPKLVIITTPNADFNVVFKRDIGQFRHPDHKFEWSREQFKDWAQNIIERFPNYEVEFSDIGEYLDVKESVGCCSQMALFIRKDLLYEEYISPTSSKVCTCGGESQYCRQTTESKLLCNCVCTVCAPDFSIGICTYYSQSNWRHFETKNIHRCNSKSEFDIIYRSEDNEENDKYKPSFNIFYKCLQTLDYPYEIDTRSEEEKLLDIIKYKITTYSFLNSRFYVEERQRIEIPIIEIIHRDIHVTVEEISNILKKNGYRVEQCICQERGISETCIITLPIEMEDVSSTSDVTEEYSSKSETSENGRFIDTDRVILSDWDDSSSTKSNKISKQAPPAAILESKPDPLFDSGYLNSPSPLEATLQFPHDNHELDDNDQFEIVTPLNPNVPNRDSKLPVRKTPKDKFAVSPTSESNRNSVLKDPSVAGPSGWKKGIHFKQHSDQQKSKKGPEEKDAESSHLDDARSITNCIIQNSLNKIEVDEDNSDGTKPELIKNLCGLQDLIENVEPVNEQSPLRENVEDLVEEPAVVLPLLENSDLANNNRDDEGNNFPANIEDEDVDEGIDVLNDNLDELVPLLENNLNFPDNNNDLPVIIDIEEAHPINILVPLPNYVRNDYEDEDAQESPEAIARASREVLFDENSEQDLLEDFDIFPQPIHDRALNLMTFGNDGLSSPNFQNFTPNQENGPISVETNTNNFPSWLLEIFDSELSPNDLPGVVSNPDDFYCRGDGLGVHPSVVTVDANVAEDEEEADSSDESSNNTADFAEVDPGTSDMFDASSLPEESSISNSVIGNGHNDIAEGTTQPHPFNCFESYTDLAEELMNEIISTAELVAGKTANSSTSILTPQESPLTVTEQSQFCSDATSSNSSRSCDTVVLMQNNRESFESQPAKVTSYESISDSSGEYESCNKLL